MFLTRALSRNILKLNFTNTQFLKINQFNFARKSFLNNKEQELIKEIENETKSEKQGKQEKSSKNTKEPTTKIIKQEVPIRISPYFSKAVSEKEKSVSNISVTASIEEEKQGATEKSLSENDLRTHKQKLASARKQKDSTRKIDVLVETIKRELPQEFYRWGLTAEDISQHHPLVARALSLDNASISEFKKARMLEIRKIFGRHERDTATPPITACALCEKVLALLTHIKRNKKDVGAYIKLQSFLTKRRKYLLYLKRTDFNSYSYVIKYYGIKDFEEHQHKKFKKRIIRPALYKETSHLKRLPMRMNEAMF